MTLLEENISEMLQDIQDTEYGQGIWGSDPLNMGGGNPK